MPKAINRNSSGWGDSSDFIGERFDCMIWEKIAHSEIVRKGEVICTGFSTKQGFRLDVIATEEPNRPIRAAQSNSQKKVSNSGDIFSDESLKYSLRL